jgi:transposase
MTEKLTVISERVDDTPLLVAHMVRMGLPKHLDTCFPSHGNWQGLSPGWTATCWLAHILSEGDHRLNHAQGWAAKRLETLSACTGQEVRALDFSDDRLALILCAMSDDEKWATFERTLNGHLLRVYNLRPQQVRVDTTTCSGYWNVTEEGLFSFGYSKDHRPDLPQVKVVLATLDPFGMPVATDIVAGKRADDPLYIPAIERVKEGLDREGLLYIGDSKMGSRATRAFVQARRDYYLCPLSATQLPEEELMGYLEPVWRAEQALVNIYRDTIDGERKLIARGYERQVEITEEVEGEFITWTERHLVVRSLKQVEAAQTRLQKRIEKAKVAVEALNERGRGKKRYADIAELRQATQALVEAHQVEGLLVLSFEETVHRRQVRGYRDRPTRIVEEREPSVTVTVDEKAVQKVMRRKGWRVYATNAPAEQLSLSQAILAYRNQYIVERGCGRLKGRPLSLTPMYLERDDHATGLIRLVSIGLRVLTLLEFLLRRRLAQEDDELAGLYAGNPKRTTTRPTAERILEAFKDLTLTLIHEPHRSLRHLTPLSDLQQRILSLLDYPPDIYTRLCANSSKPP